MGLKDYQIVKQYIFFFEMLDCKVCWVSYGLKRLPNFEARYVFERLKSLLSMLCAKKITRFLSKVGFRDIIK